MRIKLKVAITGTRNGVEWPKYNEEMELPDAEARDMIHAGQAEPIPTLRESEKAVPAAAEMRRALVKGAK